jgi:hypothetical protein
MSAVGTFGYSMIRVNHPNRVVIAVRRPDGATVRHFTGRGAAERAQELADLLSYAYFMGHRDGKAEAQA